MGLVERVSERREIERAEPVSTAEFADLLAGGDGARSASGVPVTDRRALGISAWWRGVRYLSETVAGLPVGTFRRGSGDERERVASPAWLVRPGDEVPRFALFEFLMMSMLHRGNGFAFKNRSGGQVTDLVPLHPDRVRFGLSDGRKVFEVRGGDEVRYSFTTDEILHVPALSSDGYFGIDPIRSHVDGIGAVAAADEYAGRAFSQGTSLSGYIKLPGRLDDTEADKVRAQWRRLHSGLANAHEFGILGDGAEYQTIGLDPQQTQLLETRRFGVTEIARILGVVPHKLYDLERATFSNIEHQAIESVQDSIMPWLIRLETWINHDRSLVSPSTFHEFNVDGLLRGDTKSRMESYEIAVRAGLATPQFFARRENWDAPESIHYWQRPLNAAFITENDPPGGPAITEGTPSNE